MKDTADIIVTIFFWGVVIILTLISIMGMASIIGMFLMNYL